MKRSFHPLLPSAEGPLLIVSEPGGRIVGTNAENGPLQPRAVERCWEYLPRLPDAVGLPCSAGCTVRLHASGKRRRQTFRCQGASFLLSCAPVEDRVVSVVLPAPRQSEAPADRLTAREREVLQLLADDVPTCEIAVRLGVTHGTVRTHVQRLREKLDARSQAGVVGRAYRLKILD